MQLGIRYYIWKEDLEFEKRWNGGIYHYLTKHIFNKKSNIKMNFIRILGFIAASLTTVATLPQVLKVIKTKKTTDLSLLMYITMTTGVLFWFIYGLYIVDYPLIIANFITFMLSVTILIFKIKYK